MLSARRKLPPSEFPRTAYSIKTVWFTLKTHQNTRGYNRIAVIISAKTEPRAVRRHFWKRRFYDIVKSWPDVSQDFLITTSAKLRELDSSQLPTELERARLATHLF